MLLLLYVIHTFTGFFEIFLIVDLVSWIGQLFAELFVEILESDFSTLKFLSIPTDVNIFVRRLSSMYLPGTLHSRLAWHCLKKFSTCLLLCWLVPDELAWRHWYNSVEARVPFRIDGYRPWENPRRHHLEMVSVIMLVYLQRWVYYYQCQKLRPWISCVGKRERRSAAKKSLVTLNW